MLPSCHGHHRKLLLNTVKNPNAEAPRSQSNAEKKEEKKTKNASSAVFGSFYLLCVSLRSLFLCVK
jgi:hypothetical protein